MGAESFLTLQIADFAEGVDDRVAALLTAGTGITLTYNDGAGTLTIANTGLGGSTGVADNRILRSDGTGGATVQNSAVTIDDSGNISGLGTISSGNITIGSGAGGSLTFNNAAGSPSIANLSNAGIRINTGAGARGVIEFNIGQMEATGYIYWLLRGIVASSANGVIHIHNFNLDDSAANQVLVFGPGTSSANGVRLKRTTGSTTLQLRNGDDSAAGALDCGAITASGTVNAINVRCQGGSGIVGTRYINNSNDTWSAFEFPANVSAATFSPGGGGGLFRFEGTTSAHVAWKRSSQTIQARLADDSGFASISCRDMVASGLVSVGTYTVATLPSAAANAGALAQVTDSSVTANGSAVSGSGSNRVVVFSNGSTWDVVVA